MDILAGFTTGQIAAAAIATFGAAVIRGLTGFGFGFLLTPTLALTLSPVQAVLLVNVLAFSLAAAETRFVLREADRSALWISALLVLTVMPGLLLSAVPSEYGRVLIALAAVTAFVIVVVPRRKQAERSPPGPLATGATGLVAGVATGFAAMPGISVVPYYVRQDMARVTAKASMIGIFGVSALASLASGAVTGLLEWHLLVFGLLLFR